MILGFKTLVRHNNQMQYVNLGWILVQKKKQKKNIWNRTYQEQSGKLSMEWILDDIWELLWIFLTLITECDYVRMSLLLGYTSICCKTGIKRHDVCNLLSNDSEKQHIYTEIWLIIKLMNLGDRYMYYSFNSSTYFNTKVWEKHFTTPYPSPQATTHFSALLSAKHFKRPVYTQCHPLLSSSSLMNPLDQVPIPWKLAWN